MMNPSFPAIVRRFEQSLPTPAANLALEEALLDYAEGQPDFCALRFWESPEHFVVLGYANKVKEEADAEACARRGIPVLRRCSGGGTVLQGPGCLNYSLVLQIASDPALETIPGTNRHVMERQREVLAGLLQREVQVQGITDLAIDGRKFSGNAQRRKRRAVLFHGTFLLPDANLSLMSECLQLPPRQPEYRAHRTHGDFVTAIEVDRAILKRELARAWSATETETSRVAAPWEEHAARLLAEKYSRDAWNLRA